MSTFNVLEAASALGIGRVVFASSVSSSVFRSTSSRWRRSTSRSTRRTRCDRRTPTRSPSASVKSWRPGSRAAAGLTVVSLRFPWIHTPRDVRRAGASALGRSRQPGPPNLWSYIDTPRRGRGRAPGADGGRSRATKPASSRRPTRLCRSPPTSWWPITTPRRPSLRSLTDNASLLSSAKAEQLLGFRPAHSWRSYEFATAKSERP